MSSRVHCVGSEIENSEIPQPKSTAEFTWYLSLKDESFTDEFDEYRLKELPVVSKSCVTFWVSTISVVNVISTYMQSVESRDDGITALNFIGLILPALLVWYTYVSFQKRYGCKDKMRIPTRYVGNCILVLAPLVSGLSLVRRVQLGPCDRFEWHCNEAAELNTIPLFPVLHLLISTVIVGIVYRCHSPWAMCFALATATACVFISLAVANAIAADFARMFTTMIVLIFAMYEFEYTSAHSFTSYSNLEQVTRLKAMAENERRVIEENAKDLRHFIGNVAHDLKTPLQAFVSELNCLEGSGTVVSKAGHSSLLALKSTCHYMTMTINRSLDYVKSTSGFKLQPKAETVDIQNCFQWVRGCITQYARSNMQIVLEHIASDVCQHVITDKQWLLENLLCLASNSVKYIVDGGEIRFRVLLEEAAGPDGDEKQSHLVSKRALRFEVEDNGVGIPEDKMASLFRPFRQAQRNAGGTGLGLFALANRTLAIGGTYGVQRRRDDQPGVLFWFTIPYRPDETISALDSVEDNASFALHSFEDVSRVQSHEAQVKPDIEIRDPNSVKMESSSGVEILLVEDSMIIQKASTRVLREHGHFADVANNGVECLKRIQDKSYDLILMDINMPVMDGLQTIQRIREDEATIALQDDSNMGVRRRQLVIGVSADSDAETREAALRAGMDDFVDKPLDILTLKEKCLSHNVVL